MQKQRGTVLVLLVMMLTGACASRPFKVSAEHLPDKAPPRVFIQFKAATPETYSFFVEALRQGLKRRGIKYRWDLGRDTKPPAEPYATLRIEVENRQTIQVLDRALTYYTYIHGPSGILLDASVEGGEGRNSYLSLNTVVLGAYTEESVTGAADLRNVNNAVEQSVDLLLAVYLNSLGGAPEPIEGDWVDAMNPRAMWSFRKDVAKNQYQAMLRSSSSIHTPIFEIDGGEPARSDVRLEGRYKLKPDSRLSAWAPADFRVVGCLMVIEPGSGAWFLVKKNKQRCHSPEPQSP